MPNFSVVIPLYNKENHIERALLSVVNQSIQSFEIIVVDDGSTDNGIEIIEKINDSRIKIITQKNSGAASARNTGILNSSNKYIAFLDADDQWKSEHLKNISDLINNFPDCGLFASAYETVSESGDLKSVSFISLPIFPWTGIIPNFFKTLLGNPPVWTSATVVLKSVFDKIGNFKTSDTIAEDVEMWCRIALNYDIAFTSKIGAIYYLNADNRTYVMGKRHKRPQGYIDTLTKALNNPNINQLINQDIIVLLESIELGQMQQMILCGDSKEARTHTKNNSFPNFKKQHYLWYNLSFLPLWLINCLFKIKNIIIK